MTITYYPHVDQGSMDWHALRCGRLTASEMKLIITPTLKIASNDKERAHIYTLLAQRIAGYTEPGYVSYDMTRGHEDEIIAKALYAEHVAPIEDCGFITNDKWGFTLGYSPDGLVGNEGQVEIKSRFHKFQVETLIDWGANGSIPADFIIHVQAGLLVSERLWCDFLSISPGLPMTPMRVAPDPVIQDAIINAAGEFEQRLARKRDEYDAFTAGMRLIKTERRVEPEDIHL